MKEKAQLIVITLWILVILALLAMALGRRVSLALKIAGYQKNKLKASFLLKAGVSRAAAELSLDAGAFDSLQEPWADNREIFAEIRVGDKEEEFASVSYEREEGGFSQTRFGVVDEESKINLNSASPEVLITLLEDSQISSAVELAQNILIWRGAFADPSGVYDGLYPPKGGGFSNIYEINLVAGFNPEDFIKIRDNITVYGDGKLNINTVSARVLEIFCRGIAQESSVEAGYAQSLTQKIIALREEKGYFTSPEEIILDAQPGEAQLLASLKAKITFKSENFLIAATGNAGKIRTRGKVVYNRKDEKILFWHEN